jgi:hypothetical protein
VAAEAFPQLLAQAFFDGMYPLDAVIMRVAQEEVVIKARNVGHMPF